MKRVLIIGYLHPYTRTGGSFRVLPLARYLPEFGWEPVVLTPFLLKKVEPPFRVVETGYRDAMALWQRLFALDKNKDVKREVQGRLKAFSRNHLVEFFLNRIGEIVNYPDSHRGWKPFALETGKKLLREEKFDALISCHPTFSHIVTGELKEVSGLPWVADFPDLWSRNHNYSYSPLRRFFDTRLEWKTLVPADVLTTVSEPWAETLRSLHKGKRVYAITHGFNPEEVNEPPTKLTANFTITYTGTVYSERQDVTKFFRVLRDLISTRVMDPDDVSVRFYGNQERWLEKVSDSYGLSSIVKQFARVPWEVALQRQRESQLLLVLAWEDTKERGVYGGKIFEYLGARRPILATGGTGDDVIGELLQETQAGVRTATIAEIKTELEQFYQEYKLKGRVDFHGRQEAIDNYSYREMARRFSRILDSVT